MKPQFLERGFTLIETLVGVSVFAIIAVAVYQGYTAAYEIGRLSRLKVAALALANEQLEIIRNLPYTDVGIIGGLPPGKIPREQTLTRGGTTLTVEATVRNIDDPFDGTVGGAPRDRSPADYKLVELKISCPSCQRFAPFSVTTHVAPRNLESATGNGALFIQVLDANGQPVQGASVHIENNQASPRIVIDDTTNKDGVLQIVDAPPGIEAYEITVTKTGYSTERTYPNRAPGNPNPTKPHATVVVGEVTQVTFAIDRLSTLNVATVTNTCAPVDSVDFTLRGAKLIGTNPDVPKYEASHTTDAKGEKKITNVEWDTYAVTVTSTTYDLVGSVPLLPFSLSPNTTQDLKLVVAPKDPRSLLVTVKDAGTQLPVSGATVTLSKTGYSNTLLTGRGALRQTDWSGGSGQEDYVNATRYWADDGNIDLGPPGPGPAGELELLKVSGKYRSSG
jgi:prepilin-type N-terminal cleavage/methylation domain-containing protein